MKTFSVNFHLQKHKKNKKGLCPIYMRVILNGRKIELSSHCAVRIGEWSKKNHKTTAKRKELRHINLMLENMRAEIYDDGSTNKKIIIDQRFYSGLTDNFCKLVYQKITTHINVLAFDWVGAN